MGMHSKPSRATLMAKSGACSGAALVLSASGILLAPPAGADGTPPDEVATASAPQKTAKKTPKKSVKQANKDKPAEVDSTVVTEDVGGDHAINGLINVADLNIQLVGQICNNFVPVNVLGGQGAAESVSGGLALLGDVAGADTENLKACEQTVEQSIGDGTADGSGDRNINGLINVADNNIHVPLQGCNNFVPVNVLGGQGAGENVSLSGALGIFDTDPGADASAQNQKACDQGATQDDDDDSDGDQNTNGLINVTDNNVHVPLQACNNYVPVNVLGGQGSGENVAGGGSFDLGEIFGDDTDETTAQASADNAKSCDQDADQNDDD